MVDDPPTAGSFAGETMLWDQLHFSLGRENAPAPEGWPSLPADTLSR
jgi:hypothetical protein